MNSTTKALVIREQTTGESDRLVTLLTADYGLIRAFVRGGKQLKNSRTAATSLFCYSDFSLYRGRDAFVVDNASPIEVFFDLRKDIERLSAAQYFAQLTYELAPQEQPAEEMLRLLLNSLHLLCKGSKSITQIKSVFELRIMCLGGYMPNVLACRNCAAYETDIMYFDTEEGCIYCQNCPKSGADAVPKTVMTAIRFICLTEPGRIFSFALSPQQMDLLASVTEKYVISRVGRRLTTLEFYKSLK